MGIHPLVDDILIFPSHYLLFRDCSNLASMDYTRMTRIVSLYIRIYMYIHKCVYIYIYIYIYRRFRGVSPACPPPVTGRSASFRLRFRFVRVVRAVRAGEAKLRGRV